MRCAAWSPATRPQSSPRRGLKPITVSPLTDREEVARLISKYDLLAVPVVDEDGHVLGIVTVDDIIDAIIEESTEDVQKFGGMEALDEPYLKIELPGHDPQARAAGSARCSCREMLTASAMQHYRGRAGEGDRADAVHPADHELRRQFRLAGDLAHDPRAGAARDPPRRLVARGLARTADRADARAPCSASSASCASSLWQNWASTTTAPHWLLVALTVGGSADRHRHLRLDVGSMLPFVLQASASIRRPPRRRSSPPWSMSPAW